MLECRFPRKKREKAYNIFERWGFSAVAIPALLPPPVPLVPFLFAAGAMQYPIRNFCSRSRWPDDPIHTPGVPSWDWR